MPTVQISPDPNPVRMLTVTFDKKETVKFASDLIQFVDGKVHSVEVQFRDGTARLNMFVEAFSKDDE